MKQKGKRMLAVLMALVMVFSFAGVLGACGETEGDKCENGHTLVAIAEKPATETEAGYEAYWKCSECGKMFSDKEGKNEISKPVEIPKLTPDDGGDEDDDGDGDEDTEPSRVGTFTPITAPAEGQYYMGMKCSGDVYYFVKGGMAGYYLATSSNQEDAAVVTLIADGGGWLLKLGDQYMEIEISGTHINAVYKSTPTAGKHWTWDTTYNIFTWEDGKYFYGTYGTYNTVGGGNYAEHAYDNYKAVLGTFIDPDAEKPAATGVTINKTGKLYLSPREGSYISLLAAVQPAAALQEVVWASSAEGVATVADNGKVTCVAAGETTISATAKDTSVKAEVTVVVTEKGTETDPLSIDELIAMLDAADEGVPFGDMYNIFYLSAVATNSKCFVQTGANTRWTFDMVGTSATVSCATASDVKGVGVYEDGRLDGYTLLMRNITCKKEGSTYSVTNAIPESGTRPALTGITIDATAEVTYPGFITLTATPVPANASLDGIEWHTSAQDKATVENGKVTGVAEGTAEITASVGSVTSNKCTVTVNAPAATGTATYDWTGKLGTKGMQSLYQKPASGDIMSLLNQWSPSNVEITTFNVTGLKTTITPAAGAGVAYSSASAGATMNITTLHQIKKITFKIVPFGTAKTVQFTCNGVKFQKDKGDDETWSGKLDSAFDAVITLETASNNIAFAVEDIDAYDNFAIVGMTLEY